MSEFETTKAGYTIKMSKLTGATEYIISDAHYSIVAQITTDMRDSEVSAYMMDEYGIEGLFAVSFVGEFDLVSALEETAYEFGYIHVYESAREPLTMLLETLKEWARERA